jgi:thymidylate kinase
MDPERYLVINAQKSIIEIHQEIVTRIEALTSKKS